MWKRLHYIEECDLSRLVAYSYQLSLKILNDVSYDLNKLDRDTREYVDEILNITKEEE